MAPNVSVRASGQLLLLYKDSCASGVLYVSNWHVLRNYDIWREQTFSVSAALLAARALVCFSRLSHMPPLTTLASPCIVAMSHLDTHTSSVSPEF
jgi:hypothetical protein